MPAPFLCPSQNVQSSEGSKPSGTAGVTQNMMLEKMRTTGCLWWDAGPQQYGIYLHIFSVFALIKSLRHILCEGIAIRGWICVIIYIRNSSKRANIDGRWIRGDKVSTFCSPNLFVDNINYKVLLGCIFFTGSQPHQGHYECFCQDFCVVSAFLAQGSDLRGHGVLVMSPTPDCSSLPSQSMQTNKAPRPF